MADIDKETLRLIFNAIRTSYKRSDVYKSAIARYISPVKGPRGGARYRCVLCKKDFEIKTIEMDHYPKPVVPIGKKWHELTVQEYYNHVFCYSVRALCKTCHKKHTKEQKKERNKAHGKTETKKKTKKKE